jgi:hypothetical protein
MMLAVRTSFHKLIYDLNEFPEMLIIFSVVFPTRFVGGLKQTEFEQNSQYPSDGVSKYP